MDSFLAFVMGSVNRHRPLMVFDWIKAAKLIKENNPTVAGAGLRGDWEYTGDEIYLNGRPVPREDTYVYLASTWATPEIELDGLRQDCYIMMEDSPGWDSDTYWPPEALAVLENTP